MNAVDEGGGGVGSSGRVNMGWGPLGFAMRGGGGAGLGMAPRFMESTGAAFLGLAEGGWAGEG